MKRFPRLAVAMVLAGIFMAGLTIDASAKTLRYAEFGPNRGLRAQALRWFADEIKKRSGGSLEIEFHWGKSLLGTKAVLKGVGDGVADMGSVIGFFTPKKLRAYNIGDLPVDNSDVWVGMRAMYALGTGNPVFLAEMKKLGVAYVTNYSTGPIQLICTRDVKALADLKGVKLRGSGPYGKALGDLGAKVQRMGQPKVYQALDSGLIECNQNYYYSMRAYKQYEVAPYVLELNWGQNMSFGIIINRNTLAGLSGTEKKVLAGVGSDFIDHMARVMIEGAKTDKAAMVAGIGGKSIAVTTLPVGERQELLAAGRKYVNAWLTEATKDGLDSTGLMRAYESLITKYASEKRVKGYPWAR